MPQPQGSMALPLAAPLAADGDLRSSKKGKLLGEASPPPPPPQSFATPLPVPLWLARPSTHRHPFSHRVPPRCQATPETEGAAALQKPTPPSDVESQSLTSERLRNGKALVSTRKLPKWAQVRRLPHPTSTHCQSASINDQNCLNNGAEDGRIVISIVWHPLTRRIDRAAG